MASIMATSSGASMTDTPSVGGREGEQRAHWTRILERAGGGYKVAVWLTTPVDSCVERVLARPVHPTLAGPGAEKVVRNFERSFEPPRDDEVDAIIKLAPTDDYDAVAAALDPCM